MLKYFYYVTVMMFLLAMTGCGSSTEDEKEQARLRKAEAFRNDSLAFKVATLPTLDCMPIYVAQELGLFESQGVDVKVMHFNAQMDCDQALLNNQVECAVSDVMRAERMRTKNSRVSYVTSTGAYWQLIANRKARIKEIRQLGDKMVAMTRFSATDYLLNVALDSVNPGNPVFRIQVNDVVVRLKMLQTNAMDAMMLTEPQATAARRAGHPVLLDSRDKGMRLGVIVTTVKANDDYRQKQLRAFVKAYDMACDSLNAHGLTHYCDLIKTKCLTDDGTVSALPKMRFEHVAQPRPSDLARTNNVRWRTN